MLVVKGSLIGKVKRKQTSREEKKIKLYRWKCLYNAEDKEGKEVDC
jgi:hypothetical protein